MKHYNKPYVKSVAFYSERKEDMELHERLKLLNHGDFQRLTKVFWREYLDKQEKLERRRIRPTMQR